VQYFVAVVSLQTFTKNCYHVISEERVCLSNTANTVSVLICRAEELRLLRAYLARCIYMHLAEFAFEGFNSLLPTVVKLFFFSSVYFFICSLCISCMVATIIGE